VENSPFGSYYYSRNCKISERYFEPMGEFQGKHKCMHIINGISQFPQNVTIG
jgi:hypothetical protein